jgi:hypothetical protein
VGMPESYARMASEAVNNARPDLSARLRDPGRCASRSRTLA